MNSDSTETQPTKIKSVAGATLARLARFMGFRVLMMIVTDRDCCLCNHYDRQYGRLCGYDDAE